ncbi:MAG: helix-turn-helix transcriptional regulator [Tissierellia bacterium]|nr:helix-turn-helix transcriptional regulator [Tissierellia bacterium]
MDQKKVGYFIKELRKKKSITQEELAEKLGVSNRTVSRWETGINMPDLSILLELSSIFEVDLSDLLEGERREKDMDKDLKETVIRVADLSNEEKFTLVKRIHVIAWIGIFFLVLSMILTQIPYNDQGFISALSGFGLGFSLGILIIIVLITSKHFLVIRAFKKRILSIK